MIGEFDVYGVFVPALLVWGLIALSLTAVLRRRARAHRLLSAGLAPAARGPVAAGHHPGGDRRHPCHIGSHHDTVLRRFARASGRRVLTLLIVAAALVAGRSLWTYYQEAPWTRDGRVRADVVTIAPDVSGLVTEVLVQDNQMVKRGDVLFRIDPDRFELAVQQADAAVANRQGAVGRGGARGVRTEKLNEFSVSRETQEQRVDQGRGRRRGVSPGGSRPGGRGAQSEALGGDQPGGRHGHQRQPGARRLCDRRQGRDGTGG